MEGIIGSEFLAGTGTCGLAEVMKASDFVGIYFGAHWAPPCRLFTPQLKDFYNKINGDGSAMKFEVVFCSNDGKDDAFLRNYQEMPWKAVPYSDDQRIQNLKQKFGISGIPSLVVLDKNGDVVSYDGRADIQNNQDGAFEMWQKKKQSFGAQ